MKALNRGLAAIAVIPVAGLIALSGAGVANAITCGPGYTEAVAGNGAHFCAARNDGGVGDSGVPGSVGSGGSTTVGQAPAVTGGNGGGYAPPAQAPAPAPVTRSVAPAPVQQAPSVPIPAPAPNHIQAPIQIPAPAVQERPSNNVAEVARNQASTNHDAVVTEASKNKDAATEDKSEAKSVDNTDSEKLGAKSSSPESAKVTAEATSTPSSSVSEAASPSEIDAEKASAVEPIMNAVLVIFCVGVLSYLTWGLLIKPRLNRKPSKTDESWSE